MSRAELEKEVLSLSSEELHAFAQWFAEYTANLPGHEAQEQAVREGVGRMEGIIKGQTTGLTERQFRAALR